MLSRVKVFLLISLFIAISDIAFVAINYQASNQALSLAIAKEGKELKRSFELLLSLSYENLQQIAEYVANQKDVQQLFLAGKEAVIREGGGPGGEHAAQIRQQLYKRVAPGWNQLMAKYDARQLHFHLGPGSLSFLRVHKPNKFGDRMDDLRHIIVDTYASQSAQYGFETGRVYSGLRGTTPVFAEKNNRKELVGVLETGTSFDSLLKKIEKKLGAETVVLLNEQHIKTSMWPAFVKERMTKLTPECNYYIEAFSSDWAKAQVLLSDAAHEPQKLTDFDQFRASDNGQHISITRFPLYDYLSTVDQSRGPIGIVLLASDITEQVEANQRQFKTNLVYALVGFLLVELLIFFGLRFATTRLKMVIRKQTSKLHELKELYRMRSHTDGLTTLFNHVFFHKRLEEEMNRARRNGAQLSMIMLDIDHFKQINDSYGHTIGDHVLIRIAAILKEHARSSDILGRYGGEEFAVALPESIVESAIKVAERVRQSIEACEFHAADGKAFKVTASLGIAQWNREENITEFVHRADAKLYAAKEGGRNRVES